MNLTIGTTTIEISSCTRLRDFQRGFYLDIEIPKGNTSFDALSTLFDGCTENIIITDNGKETVYNGFSLMHSVMLKDGVYHVEQCCVSEIEAQLSLAQNTIAAQAEQVMVLEEASMMQTMTIESLMLEVLPDLMASTVEEAVARALEANSSTEPVVE